MAQISSIWVGWIFGVANFGFNYLRHFSINFENSCAHLVANFLKFLKLPKHFKFACFSRMLWTKPQKIRNQKICQFEPTLNSYFFRGFWTFFSIICPKSTRMKNRNAKPVRTPTTVTSLASLLKCHQKCSCGWSLLCLNMCYEMKYYQNYTTLLTSKERGWSMNCTCQNCLNSVLLREKGLHLYRWLTEHHNNP